MAVLVLARGFSTARGNWGSAIVARMPTLAMPLIGRDQPRMRLWEQLQPRTLALLQRTRLEKLAAEAAPETMPEVPRKRGAQ